MRDVFSDLEEVGLCWCLEYRPSLEAREYGDEFDHPAEAYHYECHIVLDEMESAVGQGDTAEEAMRAALTDYRNQVN